MRALTWVIASVVGLMGCAVTTSIVREEAADDLDCPRESLSVRFERDVFHVAGCELNATYVCSRDGLSPSLCRRVGLRGVPIAKREPRVREKAAALLDCDPAVLTVASAIPRGRYNAEGCGRRIEYECVTRGDCCAFTNPGAQPIDERPPSALPPAVDPSVEAKGGLSQAHIRAVIDADIAEVRACYEAALGSGANHAGIVTVQFIIAPDGHVQVAALLSSSLGLPTVEQCVVEATRRRRFAKPAGGGIVVVTYPYALALDRPGEFVECP